MSWYLSSESDFTGKDFIQITYLAGYEDSETKKAGPRVKDLTSPKTTRAPQVALAAELNKTLAALRTDDWEPRMLEIAGAIVAAREVDGYLRFDLLKRTLEIAGQGSIFLAQELAPLVQSLESAPVTPLAKWMDPENTDGQQSREAAQKVLRGLPDLAGYWQKAATKKAEFRRRMQADSRMVGWLTRDGVKWSCRTAWTPDAAYQLVVAYPDAARANSAWRQIGRADAIGVAVTVPDSPFLREGRPVFALPQADDAKAVTGR